MKNLIVITVLAVLAVAGGGLYLMNAGQAPVAAQQDNQVKKSEPTSMQEKSNTIVDVAKNAGTFNTLVTALQEADLVETLSGEGPYTVFAPTDEAFAKIPPETLKALLADKEQLAKVLTYHVVPEEVLAADVVKLHSAKTVQGQEVTIHVTEEGKVMVDNATVVSTDIKADNGVIHVIDTVIMPK